MNTELTNALLEALSGGNQYLSTEVERRQGTISIPPDMSYDEAIRWLTVKRDADEKQVALQERIEGFPLDVAHTLFKAIDKRYGYKEAKAQQTFFGPKPPSFVAIPINAKGDTVEVLTGKFQLPGIEGEFQTAPDDSKALVLYATIKQKHVPEVKALASLTREMLRESSLYKGKAIKVDPEVETGGMVVPQFIDTSAGHETLMLNVDVISQIEATIWNPIQYMDRAIDHGIPLKRGVLLEGDYGTGKTLCANHTARIAEDHGWTYVYCQKPEHLIYAYQVARQWQPAVVFTEDVDRVNPDMVNTLSTTLDGIDTKDSQIILVMTTNHVDKVPPILIRPGRIDASIHFDVPDRDTIRHLVEFYAVDLRSNRSLLDIDIDWKRVTDSLVGNIPAVIREIVERSKLSGIRREPLTLTTMDIVTTAMQMKRHAELAKPPKSEPSDADKLYGSLQKLVGGKGSEKLNTAVAHTLVYAQDASVKAGAVKRLVEGIGDHSGDLEEIKETVDSIQEDTEQIRRRV